MNLTTKPDRHSDLKTALHHAAILLRQDPRAAEQQAKEILKAHPDLEPAERVLAAAYRMQGQAHHGLALLNPLARRNSKSADFLYEHALCQGAAGFGAEAITNLRQAVRRNPEHADAWRSLGDQLSAAGDEHASQKAYEKHLDLSTRHPELVQAADHFREGKLGKAERLCRDILKKYPTDVSAIRLLAEIGIQLSRFDDAQTLLERCLVLAPEFHMARHNYAVVLLRRQKLEDSLRELDTLLAVEPNNPNYLLLKGAVLVRKGDHDAALGLYEKVLRDYPGQARAHANYGHTLKTVGRLDEAINAYRTCIDLSPTIGEAYWSLANLKTFRFTDDDIVAMRAQVTTEGGDPDDQAHIAFALGKALEDHHQFDDSFSFYKRGNAIRRIHHKYDPKLNIYDSVRQIKLFNSEFFASRVGYGCETPDPIFIVGLPRAGSTLLEQILASHSAVDGTGELPDIIGISRRLGARTRQNPASKYPEVLGELSAEQIRDLGEGYIQTTRIQRGSAPNFIDKLPNNFQHIGLIHLILPNARIVDARRHPMAGCFSCFKQLFAKGQAFTYDLEDVGHYYRDYVSLMDHWDDVLPGRVLRVQYEDVVADSETQIRRLLDYCGLEFEEQCLRFYENERAVRTPSSEQVRRPVYKEGLNQWRNFETHLGPLKDALGPVLERYPIK